MVEDALLKRKQEESVVFQASGENPAKKAQLTELTENKTEDNIMQAQAASDIVLKFLVPKNMAGAVIGKGGETVSEIINSSGAKVHMSRTEEYFHGTSDRICTVAGELQTALTALHLVLIKLAKPDEVPDRGHLQLIMPASSCGSIIGKAGCTVKVIMENSGASVRVSSHDQMPYGLPFRLVSVSGTYDQQLKAVAMVLERAVEESDYRNQIATYQPSQQPYGMPFAHNQGMQHQGMQHHAAPMPGMEHGMHLSQHMTNPIPTMPLVTSSMVTICTLHLPDECVGSIIGKGGAFMNQVKASTGVQLKLSGRDEALETLGPTKMRVLEILGTEDAVRRAHGIVVQKLVEREQAVLAAQAQPAVPGAMASPSPSPFMQ